jgi:hypothetical protein
MSMHPNSQAALDRALAKLEALVAGDPEALKAQKARGKQVRHENVVCEQLDWSVIEPEHTAREVACKEFNPEAREIAAQVVSERNDATIEFYAPVNVPVLALPKLMCMACTIDKPCLYESASANSGMGCCADCEAQGWLDEKNRRTRFVRNELTVMNAISRGGQIVGRA